MKAKVILSWSGGKDSALALYELRESQDYEIAALLTIEDRDGRNIPYMEKGHC